MAHWLSVWLDPCNCFKRNVSSQSGRRRKIYPLTRSILFRMRVLDLHRPLASGPHRRPQDTDASSSVKGNDAWVCWILTGFLQRYVEGRSCRGWQRTHLSGDSRDRRGASAENGWVACDGESDHRSTTFAGRCRTRSVQPLRLGLAAIPQETRVLPLCLSSPRVRTLGESSCTAAQEIREP